MPILLAGKRDGVCGHAAVGMASLRITRVGVSWSTLRASRPTRIGDTKLLCPVAHASVVWPGVSIAHIGGDKALLILLANPILSLYCTNKRFGMDTARINMHT